MLAIEPQTLEELRKKLPYALLKIWDAQYLVQGQGQQDDRPGNTRSQIFDFEAGVRLIVSLELHDKKDLKLHVSTSFWPDSELGKSIKCLASMGTEETLAITAKKLVEFIRELFQMSDDVGNDVYFNGRVFHWLFSPRDLQGTPHANVMNTRN